MTRTPTVVAGALKLGDLVNGTVKTYGARFGLFLALTLAPTVVVFLVLAAFILASFANEALTPATVANRIGLLPAFLVAVLIAYAVYYVCWARMALAALDLAQGRTHPTWRSLADRTPGLGLRIAWLMVLVTLMALAGTVVVVLVLAVTTAGFSRGGGDTLGILAVLATMAAFVLGTYYLAVRWLHTVVVMAEEGLGAVASLRRSWDLTRGAFWRTFGVYLVGNIVLGLIASLGQLATTPLFVALERTPDTDTSTQVAVVLGVLLLYSALSVLLVPAQVIWVALMYLSRRRDLGEVNPGFAPPPTLEPGQAPMPWQNPYPPPHP